ncbi:UNVERIFIED_CONTAM: hypothetical protein RMT77_019251 [Armadillidium vulgare]
MSDAITSPGSEILIYTTDYKDRQNPPIKVPVVECSKEEIPKNKHWILVFKSESVTIYVDAYNKDGKLTTRIFYEEPQDVITKTSIGFVNATANDIHTLVYENRARGMTYGLNWCKGSCQSFVKELLKKLGVGSDLKIINETFVGSCVEAGKWSSETCVEAGKWSSEKAKGSFESFFPQKEKKN